MEHVPESWRPDFGKKMRPPESWKFSTESASRGQIFRRGRRGDLSPWVTPVTSAATEDSDARRGGQVTLTDVFAAIPGGAPEVHCTRARADRTHRHRAASPADLARHARRELGRGHARRRRTYFFGDPRLDFVHCC